MYVCMYVCLYVCQEKLVFENIEFSPVRAGDGHTSVRCSLDAHLYVDRVQGLQNDKGKLSQGKDSIDFVSSLEAVPLDMALTIVVQVHLRHYIQHRRNYI